MYVIKTRLKFICKYLTLCTGMGQMPDLMEPNSRYTMLTIIYYSVFVTFNLFHMLILPLIYNTDSE